jgi:beta propeller repeat protein
VIEINQLFDKKKHLKLITIIVVCFWMIIIFQSQTSPGLSEKDKPEYEIIVNETQITSDNFTQINPQISNNIVVWIDYRNDPDGKANNRWNDNPDIYAFNVREKNIYEINANNSYIESLIITDKYIIWNAGRGWFSYEVFYSKNSNVMIKHIEDIKGSEIQDGYNSTLAVLRKQNNNFLLYVYDFEKNKDTPINIRYGNTTFVPIYFLKIWGDWIVYENRSMKGTDIYAYDLKKEKEIQITNTVDKAEINPEIYRDNIIFNELYNNGYQGIGLINLSSNEYRKITSKGRDGLIYGNYVVYKEFETRVIKLYDITTNLTFNLTKGEPEWNLGDFWENRIVYENNGDIYLLEFELQPVITNGNGGDGDEKSVREQNGFSILAILILLAIIISYIYYRKKSKTK